MLGPRILCREPALPTKLLVLTFFVVMDMSCCVWTAGPGNRLCDTYERECSAADSVGQSDARSGYRGAGTVVMCGGRFCV
jgi:hypothetical protein